MRKKKQQQRTDYRKRSVSDSAEEGAVAVSSQQVDRIQELIVNLFWSNCHIKVVYMILIIINSYFSVHFSISCVESIL